MRHTVYKENFKVESQESGTSIGFQFLAYWITWPIVGRFHSLESLSSFLNIGTWPADFPSRQHWKMIAYLGLAELLAAFFKKEYQEPMIEKQCCEDSLVINDTQYYVHSKVKSNSTLFGKP